MGEPASAFHRGVSMFSRRGVSGVALIALACSMLWTAGCGGGDDGDDGPQRPAADESHSSFFDQSLYRQRSRRIRAARGTSALSPSAIDRSKAEGFGSDDRDVREPLWEHYLRAGSGGGRRRCGATPAASQDIGEIAVIQDDGDVDPASEPVRSAQPRRCASRATAPAATT